jgi:hypothetical protein
MPYLSIAMLLLGALIGVAIVIRFNIITFRLVHRVQATVANEGKAWEFWGSPARQMQLLFSPQRLIEPHDSSPIAAAKAALVSHRLGMWRQLFLAWGALIGGFLGALIPFLIIWLTK